MTSLRRLIDWLLRASAPLLRPGFTRRSLGRAGEELAERHLTAAGMKILHRQFRSHWGEVDLIAEDAGTIVFVEVKTRRSEAAGRPSEAVGPAKQAQLTRLAVAWLKQRGLLDRRSRFDVVAIVWPPSGTAPQVTHYRNAFEPRGPVG